MQEAGAAVEVVSLRKKKIKNCVGCFTCWTKTPGVCIHQDDMTSELVPEMAGGPILEVYAFPLYHYTVNAGLKTFIERTLPVIQPVFRGGRRVYDSIPCGQDFPQAVCHFRWPGFRRFASSTSSPSYVRFLFVISEKKRLWPNSIARRAEILTHPLFRKAREILKPCTGRSRTRRIEGGLFGNHGPYETGLSSQHKTMFLRIG